MARSWGFPRLVMARIGDLARLCYGEELGLARLGFGKTWGCLARLGVGGALGLARLGVGGLFL